MDKLIVDLKEQIAVQLKLKNIKPEDIGDDEPLFGAGLGLDSLDVLELIVLLKQKYKLRVTNPEDGLKVFKSVRTMAEFITANGVQNT
ncbi:phosphopantetheine-binding protein [Mucilaginibacter sp. E4BP6]|jgi:acyl carrier protein|uniref:phosphopantetheine-binding protein n=1 Tax=Mucilaginibacter sp. E4BP6 TaxID=2723089 RepID=UPI0015C6DB22|nr:phosphopantetheine-binding protein [Mucilaginibacter sp. E4BP6]NYE64407.1 acyl carrier protein [Mucilaginibacter sp. E4BP6]